MTNDAVGVARLDIVVNAETAEARVKGFRRTVSDMSSQAQSDYNQLSSAQKKLADSLIHQANRVRMTREEQILYNASIRGLPISVVKELESILDASGMAARSSAQGISQASESLTQLGAGKLKIFEYNSALEESERSIAERARIAAGEMQEQVRSGSDWVSEQRLMEERARSLEVVERNRALAAQEAAKSTEKETFELSRLIGQIDPTVAALDKLDEKEKSLRQARNRGLLDPESFNVYLSKINQQRDAIVSLSARNEKLTATTRGLAMATRNLPSQFTRLFASMQSGQIPFTMLIQNAGRLNDTFGGVGQASVAMGRYFVGLANPATLLIAAAAGLTYAWYKGGQEQRKFNETLILTGNYARTTASELSEMAGRVSRAANSTHSSSAASLMQLADTGRLTTEQMEIAATAAEKLRQANGRAVNETISDFMKLRGDPVDALLTLNEKWNFLTQAQIDNIRSLQEQGKTQDAVTAAFKVFGNTIDERTPKVLENLAVATAGSAFVIADTAT